MQVIKMNSVNIIDPQVFIKCLPAAVPSHKGVKIQARSATVYNASIPTRDEVRRENFKRRQMQMNCQGFKSPIYLPYQGIGEPISLDDKRLILATIGYRLEDLACEKAWHFVDDKNEVESKEDKILEIKPLAPSQRVLLRSNRKLNTLNQAVVQGRILVRNVKLGRGYFEILKEQEKAKKKSLEQEEQDDAERAKRQWRNPKYENSESESDHDCDEEKHNPLTGSVNARTPSTSTSSKQTRRKRSAIVRPYTPLHTNMAHCSSDINSDALFRQLCVLLWLLEATSTDSVHNMIPIHSCWKLEENCGSRSSYKKNPKPRWDSFTSNSGMMITKSFNRPKQYGGLMRRSSSQRSSFTPGMSTCTTPDQSSIPGQQDGSVPEESFDLSDEDISQQYSLGNLSADFISEPGKLKNSRLTTESSKFSKEAWKLKGPEKPGQRKPKQARPITCINEKSTQEQLSKSKFGHPRPKSSPALFQRGFSQPINESLIKQLHEKFEEVKEDKALTLHETLERMEKEWLLVCESKYRAMSIDYTSYHQALVEMQNRTSDLLSESENEIKSNGKNWFTQLEHSIPLSLKSIWYYKIILQKLANFGLGQIGSKYGKFLKVLSGLQPWQICSPDISAAIEFFRAKIIDMTVEEYERWFQQQFPFVYRPETAPVKSQNGKKRQIISNKRPTL